MIRTHRIQQCHLHSFLDYSHPLFFLLSSFLFFFFSLAFLHWIPMMRDIFFQVSSGDTPIWRSSIYWRDSIQDILRTRVFYVTGQAPLHNVIILITDINKFRFFPPFFSEQMFSDVLKDRIAFFPLWSPLLERGMDGKFWKKQIPGVLLSTT